jgi:hypothetical protein
LISILAVWKRRITIHVYALIVVLRVVMSPAQLLHVL